MVGSPFGDVIVAFVVEVKYDRTWFLRVNRNKQTPVFPDETLYDAPCATTANHIRRHSPTAPTSESAEHERKETKTQRMQDNIS